MKMKLTRLVLILFLTGSVVTADAQMEVGVFGGISVPNLSSSGSENNPLNTGYNSRLGPDFGLVREYHFSKLFSIEDKIEYSAQGGKKDGLQSLATPPQLAAYFQSQGMQAPTYLYANYKSEARLNYLRLPVLAKLGWDFGQQGNFRLSVAAGPFLSILLSAKQVTSGESEIYMDPEGQQALPGGSQSFDQTTSIRSQLHKVNFGADGNIGLAYLFGPGKVNKIFVEAGGNYGFINIQKGSANGKNNTGAATLLLGYTYRLKMDHFKMKMENHKRKAG
jgi:hypothetical protein